MGAHLGQNIHLNLGSLFSESVVGKLLSGTTYPFITAALGGSNAL